MTEIPTPEEDLSFCPSAELRGKDLQDPSFVYLSLAATIPLLRASVGQKPFLAQGGSLSAGEMLSKV